MADQDSKLISVRTVADVSSITEDMPRAASAVDAFASRAQTALAAFAQAASKSVAAQKELNAAFDRGVAAGQSETEAMESAVASLNEVATATVRATGAQNEYTESVRRESAAQGQAISGRMAASAAIRVGEGNMTGATRAAAAFASTTLGLGPILQTAFPVVGAVALTGVMVQMGEAAYHAYQKFVELSEFKQTMQAVDERLVDVTNRQTEAFNRESEELVKLTQGMQAYYALKEQNEKNAPIKGLITEGEQKEILKTIPKGYEGQATDVISQFQTIDPKEIGAKLQVATDKWREFSKNVADIKKQMADDAARSNLQAGNLGGESQAQGNMALERELAANQTLATTYGRIADALRATNAARSEGISLTEKQAAVDKLNRANQDAYKDFSAKHNYTPSISAEIGFWQSREKIAGQGAAELEKIEDRIFALRERQGRQGATTSKKDTRAEDEEGAQAYAAKYNNSAVAMEYYWTRVAERSAKGSDEWRTAHEKMAAAARETYTQAASAAKEEAEVSEAAQRGFAQLVKEQDDAVRSAAEAQQRLQQINAETQERKIGAGFALQEQQVKGQAQIGAITPQTELSEMRALYQQEEAAQKAHLLQMEKAAQDAAKVMQDAAKAAGVNTPEGKSSTAAANQQLQDAARINAQIEQLEAQHNQKMLELDQQAQKQSLALWNTEWSTMTNGFNRAVEGWIMTNQKFSTSMRKMGAQMVADMAGFWLEVAEKQIRADLMSVAQHAAANQMKVVSDATASAESQTLTIQAGMKQVLAAAKLAAANVYASVSQLPFGVGAVAAPIAAAGAFAGVMALAAFETGGIVPKTGIVMAHEKEGILPAHLTSFLMDAADRSNGKAGGGGGHTFNVSHQTTVNTMSDQDFLDKINRYSDQVGRATVRHLRDQNMLPA